MVQATFDLPEDAIVALQSLAADRGSSPSAMIQLALADLLRRRRLSPEEWLDEWRALQQEVCAETPEGLTPEMIEAEINAATDEVWAERRASRRR